MDKKAKLKILLFLIITIVFAKAGISSAFDYKWNDAQADALIQRLEENNRIIINREDVKQSDFLFCREKQSSLTEGVDIYYQLDKASSIAPYGYIEYPKITYYTGREDADGNPTGTPTNFENAQSVKVEGADIAYILSQSYPKTPGTTAYGVKQQALWAVLSQYSDNYLYSHNEASYSAGQLEEGSLAQRLFRQAVTYQQYIQNLEKFRIENKSKLIEQGKDYNIICDENTEIQTNIKENIATIGPFKVNYTGAYKVFNEEAVAFGTIKLTFKKDNGEYLTARDLGIDISEKPNRTEAIYFRSYDANNNFSSQINARIDYSDNEDGIIYTDTANINTKYGFYIYFNLNEVGTENLKLNISCNYLKTWAKVYFLKGEYTYTIAAGTSYAPYYCSECLTNSSKIDGGNYKILGSYEIPTWAPSQPAAKYSKYYCIDEGNKGEVGSERAQFERANPTQSKTYYYCSKHPATAVPDTYSLSWHFRSFPGVKGCNGRTCKATYYLYKATRIKVTQKFGCGAKTYYSYTDDKGNRYNGYAACGTGPTGKYEHDTTITVKQQNVLLLGNSRYQSIPIEVDYPYEINFTTSIEVTKKWLDHDNKYSLRPEEVKFNVYRSIDQNNWEKLTENTDFNVTWESKDGDAWKAVIGGLVRKDNAGNRYYFKVEEQAMDYYDSGRVKYTSGEYKDGRVEDKEEDKSITIENTLNNIKIGGYVWLDGNTGIKPAKPYNGIMEKQEQKLKDIKVYLYYKNPDNNYEAEKIATQYTDENGHYKFETDEKGNKLEIGYYYVMFEYDGIHYEDTYTEEELKEMIKSGKVQIPEVNVNTFDKAISTGTIVVSKVVNEIDRDTFNNKFTTIMKGQSNGGITLNYSTENGVSKLQTKNGKEILSNFAMKAQTSDNIVIKEDVDNINLGLIKRGTDLALSTSWTDAKVTINGKETTYSKVQEKDEQTVLAIGKESKPAETTYNLNLYSSDYNYRIQDYISQKEFSHLQNNNEKTQYKTGDILRIYVTYQLSLQNQSVKDAIINEVEYHYDEKYKFSKIVDKDGKEFEELVSTVNPNNRTIKIKNIQLAGIATSDTEKIEKIKEGKLHTTENFYLVFEVEHKIEDEKETEIKLGNFINTAEITSYSTDEGLIDVDSAPGNCEDGIHEDDCDKSGGLTIKVNENANRTITGTVFDNTTNSNVNGVIVQLIELKEFNGKYYEYIWQETTSGSNSVNRIKIDGTDIENYTTNVTDIGAYKFEGYIPGNYIIRFIYGDGSTYDYVHNGQDYKSVVDNKYNEEWYNKANYTQGASIARDNEARRLETMSYSVNVDLQKGTMLKLLDGTDVNKFNEVEKATLIHAYENLEIEYIDQLTDEELKTLLKYYVLYKTWMCAETSKVNVEIDGENASYTNMNFGMEKRPQTKIELKKYITGFKLTASNGQTLVNAVVDVNEYINNPGSISNKIQGIRDNLSVTNTYWSYEVSPTDINTIVEGANLEYVYDLVVENKSEKDYLSTDLVKAYESKTISEYAKYLTDIARTVKTNTQTNGTHTYGNYLGTQYYVGGTNNNQVKTEVTQLKDYVNDNLRLVNVNVPEDKYHMGTTNHYVLNDAYGLDSKEVTTIVLDGTSKKLISGEWTDMSTVTLGKDSLSASGALEINNYIAEVMAYTNAAGRRADTTPGNAEFVDKGIDGNTERTHEVDEADTARIGIGAATGRDEKTPYVWLITIVAGIVIIAVGAVVTKKYIIK